MTGGLVSISFRKLSVEEIISLVQRCGLSSIEWGGDIHVPCGDLDRAGDVGRLTREAGLRVACYGSYSRLTDGDAWKTALETAAALGAPLIRVWAGNQGSASASEEERAVIVRAAQQMAQRAAQLGIDVAFEFHSGTLTDTAESAARLMKEINRDNVGCMWQPPVGMSMEDCLSGIRAIGPWLRNVHTYSWTDQGERLPLAGREERWGAYLSEIAKQPGEHALLLEFVQRDDPEQFVQDAASLRRWLEGSMGK